MAKPMNSAIQTTCWKPHRSWWNGHIGNTSVLNLLPCAIINRISKVCGSLLK